MAFRLIYENRSYVREPGDRLETDLGVLELPPDVEPGDTIETHLGHAFEVRTLRIPDFADHFERTGAPMLPRDVGRIIGETGVGLDDQVLDIGTGTGVLAAALGTTGATVTTIENDPGAATVARENMRMAGVADRVTVETADGLTVESTMIPTPIDVLTLDSGDAPELIDRWADAVCPGGFLAAYSPFVENARETDGAARAHFTRVRTVETIHRELDVDERGTRPTTAPVGHTGYLTFARRR